MKITFIKYIDFLMAVILTLLAIFLISAMIFGAVAIWQEILKPQTVERAQ